ncbi:MAG: hypothetical protein R3F30_11500 [Planctomycetota bacterium]
MDSTPDDTPMNATARAGRIRTRPLRVDEVPEASLVTCPLCQAAKLRVKVLPLRGPREGRMLEAWCPSCGAAGQRLVDYNRSATSSAK